jgi:hypothetical protein
MRGYITTRGIGVSTGSGGLLLGLLLAPLALAGAVAAATIAGTSALAGALIGRGVRLSPQLLERCGWTTAALIPLGLVVAFFGHESDAMVHLGLYTSLAAIPLSVGLIAASVFAD